ncbi:radical SAM family heme chaperone HemW [Geomicrobium sediminis]|uniref:Heme chaperone HemW n=1 Tax=Geomicrobium sediminis TaxID=1347788 RepID=A0ABS2PFL4_9BACL|nr:radical SAM family heme chaperone HemW [Geomicrobium sediminis]MBM7633771.1 oxygen-independent coproporphyrinogen-3 oxidase [Geomicrobium sediminis]
MKQGLYVHIPFCKQICHYCDFNKVLVKNQPVDTYVSALLTEGRLRLRGNTYHSNTIYIGGGTPTALSANQLDQLFTNLHKAGISWDEASEVTLEVNPDGVTTEQLKVVRAHGINRLSVGVQTFDTTLLETIGRTHSVADVHALLEKARGLGFNNISIDLMYALPGQTEDSWLQTVDRAIELQPDHISAYGLKIEPKTQFHNWQKSGQIIAMDQDDEADLYELLINKLEKAGYFQYEISNFAKSGKESRHNLLYWENESYLALGAGAHGYVEHERYQNIGPIPHYLKAIENEELPTRKVDRISKNEQMEEEMFLGLRLRKGVSQANFDRKYEVTMQSVYGEAIERLLRDELVEWNDDCLRLTERGQLLGNEVFAQFLLPKDEEAIR